MNRASQFVLTTGIAVPAFTGCKDTSELPFRQQEPMNRQPPEEIRRKIVGLWTVDQDANGPEPILSLNLHTTGDVSVVACRRTENWAEKPIDESPLVRKTSNR